MKTLTQRFQSLMNSAARLTRGGDLRAATDAIQTALQRASLHPLQPAAGVPTQRAKADVVDVVAREVPRADGHEAPTAAGEFITGQHQAVGLSRDYKLFIPPHRDGAHPPLIVMLHGCKQNPDDFAAGTRMNELAKKQGFFVLYPAQSQSANAMGCWNWFKHNHQGRGAGEPALIESLTREVIAGHGIDPHRVYVAGLSAGGAMAAILGDAYPDTYAAVGVHSGLATGAASDVAGAFAAMQGGAKAGALSPSVLGRPRPARPARNGDAPSTIVFHGDADTTVNPSNGDDVIAACLGSTESTPMSQRKSASGRDYSLDTYRDAEGQIRAERWTLHGAGHAWSGGSTQGSYADAAGPDASREMLRFFLEHPARATVAGATP